jgi:amino acid adenylation domain-containing protein
MQDPTNLPNESTGDLSSYPSLVAIKRSASPLSFAQERLWLLNQFEPDSSACNLAAALRLRGKLNLVALEQSLAELVCRHEILRTTFSIADGQPQQIITPKVKLRLPVVDLSQVPQAQRDKQALNIATELAQQPFNLAEDLMLRVKLLQLRDDEYLFIWCWHGIVGDRASASIFYDELLALYESFDAGKLSPLPELPIQYTDFAQWQREWLQGEILETQLEYWEQKLSAPPNSISLPADYPSLPAQTCRGDRFARTFSKRWRDDLLQIAQKSGTTLFTTLLAAFKTLLYRYSGGQEDLLISFTNTERKYVETQNLIGQFSNTLVLRNNLTDNLTFYELLDRVKDEVSEVSSHQDLPFEKLVEKLNLRLKQERSPLFQIKFALNPDQINGHKMSLAQLSDIEIEPLFNYIYSGQTEFDLILFIHEQAEGLTAVFEYNADLFTTTTVERMMNHLEILLESIVANPDDQISNLQLLAQNELETIRSWNKSTADYPSTCLPHWWESQVDKNPEAIALIAGDRQLTYRELNQRANQLAHYLKAQGVKTEDIVAIYTERSVEMMVGLLGVVKAGGVFLLLDPVYPQERRSYKLRDAQPKLILTQAHLVDSLSADRNAIFALDQERSLLEQYSQSNPKLATTPDHLAYLIYTSGSTGKPKGVCVTHRSLANHCAVISQAYELSGRDQVLQSAGTSFDVIIEEIFPSWRQGATVVLRSQEMQDSIAQFLDFIRLHQITVANLPTALWQELCNGLAFQEQNLPQALRLVIVGGEKVLCSAFQNWKQQIGSSKVRWLNAYGLTETTITSTVFDPEQMTGDINAIDDIPIGRPLPNTQAYILDRNRNLCPIGIPGELYIGGLGVAQGYLNQPELTAKRFITNPFTDFAGDRLCKTGDLVRYRPDGNIEFIGRSDNQLKIRGFRIEPIEIESTLMQYPGVQQAVVMAKENNDGEKQIVAYLIPLLGLSLNSDELKSFLAQKLPRYMVPSLFVILEAFPLTPNGKIDRQALASLSEQSELLPKSNFVTSRDDIEQSLVDIWEAVLKFQPIGIDDNFFDLGGHSLLAVRLFSQIEAAFNRRLPLSVLLNAPTIKQLAEILRQDDRPDVWSPLVSIQVGSPTKRPLFCIHGGGFNVLIYRELAMQLPPEQPVYGLQARGLDGISLHIREQLEDMAADYIDQIRTVQPQGPYALAGLSNGGNIALEMAQQLMASGEKVAFLGMFDSYGPNSDYLLPPISRFLSSIGYALRYMTPRLLQKLKEKGIKATSQIEIPSPTTNLQTEVSQNQESVVVQSSVREAEQQDISPKIGTGNIIEIWMDRVSQYILDRSPWAFLTPKQTLVNDGGETAKTLRQLEAELNAIYKAYAPKPYAGRIHLFLAQEPAPGYYRDPYLGWNAIALNGVEVYKIPGNHSSIVTELLLAERVQECLAEMADI